MPLFRGLPHVLAQQLPAPQRPVSEWDSWPFNTPGAEPSWLFYLAKGVFIIIIFAVIIFFVRWLFGPGGRLAEPWMREEWEERRLRELAELEDAFAQGRIDRARYERRKRKLRAPA